MLFVAGKYDNAISRIRDLSSVSMEDKMTYCYIQVFHATSDCGHTNDYIPRFLGKCIFCEATMQMR